jgi:hypothetical protein
MAAADISTPVIPICDVATTPATSMRPVYDKKVSFGSESDMDNPFLLKMGGQLTVEIT